MLRIVKKVIVLGAIGVLTATASAATVGLTDKEKAVVAIAANTAVGQLDRLQDRLKQGLAAGLTVREINEVLIQLYAYTGFPRSLNGINTFMKVVDERRKAGINDVLGREPSALPSGLDKNAYGAQVRARLGGRTEIPPPAGYQVFAPAIDTFLKEHLFCDIFIRDNLDEKSRELATVGALAAMTGTTGQMRFHMMAAINTGSTVDQLKELTEIVGTEIGTERKMQAQQVLKVIAANHQNK